VKEKEKKVISILEVGLETKSCFCSVPMPVVRVTAYVHVYRSNVRKCCCNIRTFSLMFAGVCVFISLPTWTMRREGRGPLLS
jgi:hypothetical protein